MSPGPRPRYTRGAEEASGRPGPQESGREAWCTNYVVEDHTLYMVGRPGTGYDLDAVGCV